MIRTPVITRMSVPAREGNVALRPSMASRSDASTTDGFCPRRMSTMPSTVSYEAARLTTPWRGAQPSRISATSRTCTGVPSWVATRVAPTSASDENSAVLRTTNCSAPRSSTPPEALTEAWRRALSRSSRVRSKAASRAGKRSYNEYIEEWRKVARACGDDLEAEVTAESERLEAEYDKHRLAELIQSGGVADGPALPPAHDETPRPRSNGRANGPAADAAGGTPA